MARLLLVLALVALAQAAAARDREDDHVTCSVSVSVYDDNGRLRPSRRVAATYAPAVVFRGKLDARKPLAHQLLFDVYDPRGVRYRVLPGSARPILAEREGRTVRKVSKTREASMAVAGSSITLTSLYGRWRVEPRIEGQAEPCGRPEYFTLRP